MKVTSVPNLQTTPRSRERGAALITALMVATLVLGAGGALILTTGMATTTAVDATAEMQAYYGAEAGLQQALNILRGNVAPHDVPAGTQISFRNAVTVSESNASTDPVSAPLRLSGWLQYDYTSSGSAYPDRVKVNPTDASYTPLTGIAFTLLISDPDNTPVANGEPRRLLIHTVGYGPKGAVKQLEMVVNRALINFPTPATITLAGGSSMTLNLGNSNASGYTGNDIHSPPISGVSAVAVSPANVSGAQASIDALNAQGGGSSQVTPSTALSLTAANTPSFLANADATRLFLQQAREMTQGSGRYFTTQAAVTGGLGTSTAPLATFIDNYGGTAVNLGSGYAGCGLLIVTGDLNTSGNTDFQGVILVLGSGQFNRNGNGNGHVDGTIVVATLDPRVNGTGGFGAPTFSVNGGGNSDVRFDSDSIRRAFNSAGPSVVGIHEY